MAPDKGADPFLATIADTAAQIEDMRRRHEALTQEISERQQKADELIKQITALNGLRSAYGYPPA